MASMLKIGPTEDLLKIYSFLQLKKKGDKPKAVKWFTAKIKDDKIVEDVKGMLMTEEKEMTNDEAHAAFTTALKASGEPRYGACDYKNKVYFVSYIPDTAKVRQKMKYSSVRESLKSQLQGVSFDLQATDEGEISKDTFDGKIKAI